MKSFSMRSSQSSRSTAPRGSAPPAASGSGGWSWRGPLVAVLAVLGCLASAPAWARETVRVVVIDPGHGGDDMGAIGAKGTAEKDLTLKFAAELGRRLEEAGMRVVYTRRKDVFGSLVERTRMANMARADLYLSIHANSSKDSSVKGLETYFMSVEASEGDGADVAITENQVFKREAAAPGSDDLVGSILGDMIRTDHMRVSEKAATAIHQELARVGEASRGVRQDEFVVLAGVNMPSVLIELGFLTNGDDERKLARESYRADLAGAIVRAVKGLDIVDRSEVRGAEARASRGQR